MRNRRLQAAQLREAARPSSDFHSAKVLPNTAMRFSQRSAFTQSVKAGNERNISARQAPGVPMVNTQVANGMPVEEQVQLTIDTTGLGNAHKLHRIVLWDKHGFHDSEVGWGSNPPGTVYIGSVEKNRYPAYLSGNCPEVYHYDSVLVQVEPSANAEASAQQQFQQGIKRYAYNTSEDHGKYFPVTAFRDGYQTDKNVRSIPFGPTMGRVDGHVAWEYYAYEGMVITFTLYPHTYTRG